MRDALSGGGRCRAMCGQHLVTVRLETIPDGLSCNDTSTLASDRTREIDAHDRLILSRLGMGIIGDAERQARSGRPPDVES
jgi:hypothetical protein